MGPVDALTGTYRLGCPAAGSTTRVRLSSFRQIDRLPGPAHPAVYRVVFACACGGEHVGLVGHDALASELTSLAAARIGRGEWPWCFFCRREDAPRPVTPSAFRLLAPCP